MNKNLIQKSQEESKQKKTTVSREDIKLSAKAMS